MRSYLFSDRDRERLRAWLESGAEDDGTRTLFVAVRRNLNRIAGKWGCWRGWRGGCRRRGGGRGGEVPREA